MMIHLPVVRKNESECSELIPNTDDFCDPCYGENSATAYVEKENLKPPEAGLTSQFSKGTFVEIPQNSLWSRTLLTTGRTNCEVRVGQVNHNDPSNAYPA